MAAAFVFALITVFVAHLSLGAEITNLPDYGPLLSKNFAGSIDMGDGRSSFYYFIESETNPSTDPLLLWLNGGPGCSSLLGLFTEIGPYLVRHDGTFFRNQYTWTREANVLFLESPPGVGFSVDKKPPTNWTDEMTADLNYAFLVKWLDLFPTFRGRRFVIAGESYAGHYVPQLAHKILRGKDTGLLSMMDGFMVGNPCTGTANGDGLDWCFFRDDPTLDEYLRTHALKSLDPLARTLPADYDEYDILERYCEAQTGQLLSTAQWNRQNGGPRSPHSRKFEAMAKKDGGNTVNKQGIGSATGPIPRYGPCNDKHLAVWLSRRDVQTALHGTLGTNWSMCNDDIIYPVPWDKVKGVLPLYEDMMKETKWKMMIYSGDADTVVNFIQTERVVISLNRTRTSDFAPWFYTDMYDTQWTQLGGYYQLYDRLSWASVRGAGHMVPMYVPAAAWQLFKSFMATGEPGLKPKTFVSIPTTEPPQPAPGGASPRESSPDLPHVAMYVIGGVLVGVLLTVFVFFLASRLRQSKQNDSSVDPEYLQATETGGATIVNSVE